MAVCYPTSYFNRKYLLVLLPSIFTIVYNIPKFFEIVECSDEERYTVMLKEYIEQNNITREGCKNRLTYAKNIESSTIEETDQQHQNVPQIESLETHMCLRLNLNDTLVLRALEDNVIECDPYGHRISNLRKHLWYILLYQFLMDLILVEIVPWLTIIFLNFRVWKTSLKFQERRRALLNRSEDAPGSWYTF